MGNRRLIFCFAGELTAIALPSIRQKLVLLDLKLPKVNGLQVLEEIKSKPATRSIPVVALTSSGEEKDLVACYELGVNSYIQKPVDFDQFRETIKALGLYWTNPLTSRRRRRLFKRHRVKVREQLLGSGLAAGARRGWRLTPQMQKCAEGKLSGTVFQQPGRSPGNYWSLGFLPGAGGGRFWQLTVSAVLAPPPAPKNPAVLPGAVGVGQQGRRSGEGLSLLRGRLMCPNGFCGCNRGRRDWRHPVRGMGRKRRSIERSGGRGLRDRFGGSGAPPCHS